LPPPVCACMLSRTIPRVPDGEQELRAGTPRDESRIIQRCQPTCKPAASIGRVAEGSTRPACGAIHVSAQTQKPNTNARMSGAIYLALEVEEARHAHAVALRAARRAQILDLPPKIHIIRIITSISANKGGPKVPAQKSITSRAPLRKMHRCVLGNHNAPRIATARPRGSPNSSSKKAIIGCAQRHHGGHRREETAGGTTAQPSTLPAGRKLEHGGHRGEALSRKLPLRGDHLRGRDAEKGRRRGHARPSAPSTTSAKLVGRGRRQSRQRQHRPLRRRYDA
jgi:hypothetical protein